MLINQIIASCKIQITNTSCKGQHLHDDIECKFSTDKYEVNEVSIDVTPQSTEERWYDEHLGGGNDTGNCCE